MIALNGVGKTFDNGSSWPLDRVDLVVRDGELLVLLGESGCGKTTTLKSINRLIEPTRGDIEVDGRDVLEMDLVSLRRSMGYVFQGVGLFPHLTVGENVGLGPRLLKWPESWVRSRVEEMLHLVGLAPADYMDRSPRGLSGGQRQRVGIARALASRPSIMLMDEPFGALDALTRDSLRAEYGKLHRALKLTSLVVTHDITEALLMADRIAVMSRGRIVRLGSPRELMHDPGHDYVAALMDSPRNQADRLEALLA